MQIADTRELEIKTRIFRYTAFVLILIEIKTYKIKTMKSRKTSIYKDLADFPMSKK